MSDTVLSSDVLRCSVVSDLATPWTVSHQAPQPIGFPRQAYCIPPGSSTHRISQASILEWGAISYSRGPSQPRDQTPISCISYICRHSLSLAPPEPKAPDSVHSFNHNHRKKLALDIIVTVFICVTTILLYSRKPVCSY